MNLLLSHKPEIIYNKLTTDNYNKSFNKVKYIDTIFDEYKESIISKELLLYLNYSFSIYGYGLKIKNIKDNIYKRVKLYGNWFQLFNYNCINNIIQKQKNIKYIAVLTNSNITYYTFNDLYNSKFNVDYFNFNLYKIHTYIKIEDRLGITRNTEIKEDYITSSNKIRYNNLDIKCNYRDFQLNKKYDFVICNIEYVKESSSTIINFTNTNIYLDELIVSLKLLNVNGSILLLIHDIHSKLMSKIIYIVSTLFEKYELLYNDISSIYSRNLYIKFESYKNNKDKYNVISILEKLSDLYNTNNIYNSFNIVYNLQTKLLLNYGESDLYNTKITKLYLNDYKKISDISNKFKLNILKFNEEVGFKRIVYYNNIIYFIKYILLKPDFNKTEYIKKQYHKQIICSYLYSLTTSSKILRDKFNKLNFNITDKKIFESIYQLPAICKDLIDYKCYNQLIINQVKNKLNIQIIKENLDNELYDPIIDYIKYFNEFYKIQKLEKLVSKELKINDVLKFTKKIKISKAVKISNKDILYLNELLNIKKVLPNISNKDITVLFKLDILDIAKKINSIQDSITILLYHFKKVHLWKSSFDFDMSTIYFIGCGFELKDKLTKYMIEKCRHNISKYINVLLHNLNEFYVDRDMISTIYSYYNILSKKHRKGLIKYAKSKKYIR